ncbi:NtaA/DmoA family FMN-dependent monooxygenase [Microbacterium sp. NPDC055683]
MSDRRHIHLGLWLTYLSAAGWTAPDSRAEEVNGLEPYAEIARIAEDAKLDAVIRGDGVASHVLKADGPYAGSLELLTLLAALSARTSRIGLIGTASTTFSEPFTLARQFATIDHLSGGRAGWNIVTSSDGERNYGYEAIPDQDARYARADEFLEVVERLWASWDPDAVRIDRATRTFVDPARVQAIDHDGAHFRVAGPLNVARSPQGRPVLIQAGSSERGRRFAAEHAEVIFTAQREVADGVAFAADLRDRVAAAGRDPGTTRILPGLGLYLAETETEALELYERELEVIDYDAARERLEKLLGGVDLSDVPLDDRVPDDRWPDTAALARRQSRPQIFIDLSVRHGYTLRRVLQAVVAGFGHGRFVGTPEQAADRIVQWADAGAADGFVIFPSGGWQTIHLLAEQVVPILRERGRFREEYEGSTLRDHFGLPPVPAAVAPTLRRTAP